MIRLVASIGAQSYNSRLHATCSLWVSFARCWGDPTVMPNVLPIDTDGLLFVTTPSLAGASRSMHVSRASASRRAHRRFCMNRKCAGCHLRAKLVRTPSGYMHLVESPLLLNRKSICLFERESAVRPFSDFVFYCLVSRLQNLHVYQHSLAERTRLRHFLLSWVRSRECCAY